MDKDQVIDIFEASPVPSIVFKADPPSYSIVQANSAFQKLTGKTKQQLVGIDLFEAFPSNEINGQFIGLAPLMKSFEQVTETKKEHIMEPFRYDLKNSEGTFEEKYWRSQNSPVLDKDGSVEFILITTLDVTEEVIRQREIDRMINNTKESFILIDRNFRIINFNDQFFKIHKLLFDYELEKGRSIFDYDVEEHDLITRKKFERVFKGETLRINVPFSNEKMIDGIFDVTYKPIKDNGGDISLIFLSMRDITEEQKLKREMEVKESRFRALVENGNDVVIILSPDGTPSYVSPSIKNVLGYEVGETIDFDVSIIIHPDDQGMVMLELQKSLDKPGVPLSVPPARMKHKDGSWRWFDGTITNLLHDPAIGGIVDNFREITERVNTENKLLETKQLYESLVQSIEGVVWEAQAETNEFNFVSRQSLDLFGYEPKQFIADPNFWKNKIHPEDREEAVSHCISQTRKGLDHDFEYRFKKADGDYIWIRDIVRVIKNNGSPAILRGLMLDISEYKELLRQLDATYEMAKIGTWELNLEDNSVTWSPFIKRMHEVPLDYSPTLEEALSFYQEGINRDSITKAVENAIAHRESFHEELEIITAKGTKKWIRAVGTPEMKDGECVRIFGSTQDITERMLAKENLKTAEEKYRNVVEHSTNMFYTHDTEGVLNYVSPQSEHFLGYKPEVAKIRWTEFITDHPINIKGVAITQKAIDTGEIQPPYELQLRTAKNKIIWVEVHEAPLVKDGKTKAIIGSLTDITKRKKYEEQLEESLNRYNYVSKATRDAIYDWDILNDKIQWGSGFNNLFGHVVKDQIFQNSNWEKLLHPEDLLATKTNLSFTLNDSSMKRWNFEYRLKKDDGSYAYVSDNGFILRDKDGIATRMIGTIQDITEREISKKEIQASLSEKETLLAEIHHRVKNNLAVVSGMMQLQAFETDDEDLKTKLYDSVVRIKTMASVHELLYQSRSFSKLEFSETLTKLVENISNTLQTHTDIDVKIECQDLKLNINQAIPASLIVNEVLTNAYKHAFKGYDKGKIHFHLFEDGDEIQIKISDNGIGFTPADLANRTSLGFHLIEVLCDQIDAHHEFHNRDQGTSFLMKFKRLENSSGIGSSHLN